MSGERRARLLKLAYAAYWAARTPAEETLAAAMIVLLGGAGPYAYA